MNTPELRVIDYGVDYITVTATTLPRTTSLLDVAREHLQSEAQAGNDVTKWRGLGYGGWTSGGVSYGVGPQGVIARMTSGYASQNWKPLFQWGMKCTRIDVQVTVVDGRPAPEIIGENWDAILSRWQTMKRGAAPEVRAGPHGPHRITVASRTSERYGRIYDKGLESKIDYYRDAVRFEVEFKGGASHAVAHHLCTKGDGFAGVCPQVLGFFRKHGSRLELAGCSPAHVSGMARNSDRLSKLRYLRTSIRPLVQSLIQSGHRDELMQALGLVGDVSIDADL